MQIEKQFVVRASPERVWAFLTDPHRVAGCLPGAEVTGQADERTYDGKMTVKVGPVMSSYRGKVRFENLNPAERSAEIVASGQDVRGKGGAEMRMTSRLVERASGETEVTVVSEVNVTGILAQFGRGMIQDVSDQLFGQFTAAVRDELEAGAPRPAGEGEASARSAVTPSAVAPDRVLDVGSLGSRAVVRALARTARRPVAWVVAVLAAALIAWLLLP